MRLSLRRRVNFEKNLMFKIRSEKEAWREALGGSFGSRSGPPGLVRSFLESFLGASWLRKGIPRRWMRVAAGMIQNRSKT